MTTSQQILSNRQAQKNSARRNTQSNVVASSSILKGDAMRRVQILANVNRD